MLGFGTSRRPVNMKSQRVRINQWGVDNSFATEHKDETPIRQGGCGRCGGRRGDPARIRTRDPFLTGVHLRFAKRPARSAKGLATTGRSTVSTSSSLRPRTRRASLTGTRPHTHRLCPTACGASIGICTIPTDLNGEVHHDGEIWSRALWDIRQAVGNIKADTLILEAQFGFPGTTMRELAGRTVTTAGNLYGRSVAAQVRTAFVNRGLL